MDLKLITQEVALEVTGLNNWGLLLICLTVLVIAIVFMFFKFK